MCFENYDEMDELMDGNFEAYTYEVWAMGYNADGDITDAELLLGTFEDPDAAVQYASIITFADIRKLDKTDEFFRTSDLIHVEVETVVEDEEGSANVGTVFNKTIVVTVEDIRLEEDDYSILEDGTLKVACKLLRSFNKNDKVRIFFIKERTMLTYKINSRVIYDDGEYYHLEFIY